MRSRDRVSAAAWVIVQDAQAAEDIFQNVAVKALTRDVAFDTEGAVLSWAFITARREGIDWLRRHRRESAGLDAGILELLEQEWQKEPVRQADSRLDALRKCLGALPSESRRLLRLRYFEGCSCSEVAEHSGAGLDAIYKRLSRLHHGLRECIELRLADSEASPA